MSELDALRVNASLSIAERVKLANKLVPGLEMKDHELRKAWKKKMIRKKVINKYERSPTNKEE